MTFKTLLPFVTLAAMLSGGASAQAGAVDVRSFPNVQAAIDANPGRIIQLPAGEYTIDRALRITRNGTELHGPARILQTNPEESFMLVENASAVRVTNLEFTRSEGKQQTTKPGIDIQKCRDVEIAQVRISENHTRASIHANASQDIVVRDCTILNYKGPTIDDRTRGNPSLYGFAFRSVDGTGIQFREVNGGAIRDNRIQEHRILPTREIRDRHKLGELTVKPDKPGRLMQQDIFNSGYTNNWHQGAAIQVGGPTVSGRIIISGNFIENAAQGLDLHADNVSVTNNIISHAMIGMKTMHGAKHVLIDGNQFTHCDLWGLKLMPGASSRASSDPETRRGHTAENVDGGTIVSNNIFSHFGLGEQRWNWEGRRSDYPERNPIVVLFGQLEENPSTKNILITGNLVYDSGQDSVLIDGKWTKQPPHYDYALYVEQQRAPAPINVHVHGNLLDPGRKGATNFGDQEVVNPGK
jgi:hypothetical protein